jgi:hypothetical protein
MPAPAWNSETAREAGRRSGEARRGAFYIPREYAHIPATIIQEAIADATKAIPSEGQVSYSTPVQTHDKQKVLDRVRRLEEQMDSIDELMEGPLDPDSWHKLTTSKAKLFEQWRILSGIPMPGSLKPTITRQKVSQADLPPPE